MRWHPTCWALLLGLVATLFPLVSVANTPLRLEVNPRHPTANDGSLHTAAQPFGTITAALVWAHNHGDRPVEIYIHNGTYREALGTLENHRTPLRLVAQTPDRVRLRGSMQWPDWQWVSTNGAIQVYRHPWQQRWGAAGNPWTAYNIQLPALAQRGEMVWLAGAPLRQRLALAELMGHDFYVDEAQGVVYVALPEGVDPAVLEVAIHREALRLLNSAHIALVGLRFEHYGGAFSQALRIEGSQDIEVHNCTFWGNNWGGLEMHNSDRIHIRQSRFLENGWRGMAAGGIRDLAVHDVLVSGNNWRGGWAGFYDWDAGEKYFHLRRATFDRYRAIANQAAGLWLDTDNQAVAIRRSQLIGNAVVGLFIEAGTGPVTVENSVIAYNYAVAPNYLQTPGVFGWAAQAVTLRNNWIIENEGAQIGVRDPYPRRITLPDTGESVTITSKDWRLENNYIGAQQQLLLTTLRGHPFLETLTLGHNQWWSDRPQPFHLEGTPLSWQAWQQQYGSASDRFRSSE
ncbi:right-handed parallel beta-helix repeat-containing protein [Synechococcus sp. PCC 6716]|nr:right-handed parallel beta-helix repeat-containing protein [Synechococcus sp. PCC 6716]